MANSTGAADLASLRSLGGVVTEGCPVRLEGGPTGAEEEVAEVEEEREDVLGGGPTAAGLLGGGTRLGGGATGMVA
jgi:hypothetical protein